TKHDSCTHLPYTTLFRSHGDTDYRGTIITFDPDPTIFESKVYKYDVLAHRLRELAFLNKGLRLSLTDKREKNEDGSFKHNDFYRSEEHTSELQSRENLVC